MSLRLRLIFSYAALIVVLGLAAWWGVQRLTADLTQALGETAASVGRSVVTVLRETGNDDGNVPGPPAAMPPSAAEGFAAGDDVVRHEFRIERRVGTGSDGRSSETMRVVVDGRELDTHDAHAVATVEHAALDVQVRHLHGEPAMLALRGEGIDRAIPLSNQHIDTALDRFSRQLGGGLLLLFGFGLLLSVWIAQRVARPLRVLAQTAQAVGGGALGTQAREQGAPEVRQTIAAFNRMSAQLQKLDAEAASLRADRELAELGEIGRGLAHSLRNPLHVLGLSLQALAAQPADPARAQALAQAGREQLQRVDQALRGFLALSAGAGVEPHPTSLREVIDDVVLEAAQRAVGRVTFRREGGDITFMAVPAELRVMLHAIVVNALDASPDGGIVTVALAHDAATRNVVVEVSDAGQGMPDAIRARLFQPHVSSKPHGAGMGLYLAQRLATLRYRGVLEIQSRTPHGTVARLRLQQRENGTPNLVPNA